MVRFEPGRLGKKPVFYTSDGNYAVLQLKCPPKAIWVSIDMHLDGNVIGWHSTRVQAERFISKHAFSLLLHHVRYPNYAK